ncbi:MAG: class B sortase [Lachnospirales bacterium]
MFFLCLLLVFLISAAQIFRIIMENRHSQVLQQELERMFFQEFSEPERSRGEDVQKIQEESEGINLPAYDFSALKKQNEDVVGWLYMPEAGISQVVVQADDNEYYLHRNLYREYAFAGTVFMDYRCIWGESEHTIFYGHNMTDGSVFAPLKQYMDSDFGVSHPRFWYITPEEIYQCDIFSVYLTTADDEEYTRMKFMDGTEWLHTLEHWKERSAYAFPEIEFYEGSQVLTLSTCNYEEVWTEGRQALHAVLTPVSS